MVAPTGELDAPGGPPLPTGVPAAQIAGRSPWYLAWLRLRRNKIALACGVLIVLFCLAAPLWAEHVAHTGPNDNHITDKVVIDGKETDVVAPDGTPIGPGLHGRFLLGADQNGRDVLVRLMYGGRTSIYIGLAAAAGLTRYLSAMLYGLTPLDAATYAAVASTFIAVAALACYAPARLATKVDPAVALRCD